MGEETREILTGISICVLFVVSTFFFVGAMMIDMFAVVFTLVALFCFYGAYRLGCMVGAWK